MIDSATFEEMRKQLESRVKPSRYAHSMGVSRTAAHLARVYGADENAAAVAGLLHDWDKALSFKELKRIAKKHGLASKAVRKQMPGVLHALTAPYSLRKAFPELSDEILHAISLHTCGAKDMNDLDKIVFIADLIEPGRSFSDVQSLRDAAGKVSLDELFFMAYASTLVYLIGAGLPVHPDSLDVWNALVERRGVDGAGDAVVKGVESRGSQRTNAASPDEAGGSSSANTNCACGSTCPTPSVDGLASELAARIVAGRNASHLPRRIVIE